MLRPEFTVLNSTNSEEAEIYLYGIIGRYWKVDTEVLIPRIENLRVNGLKKITFYVNSNGGEVPQGILLFNYLARNNFEVTFVIDGIAASMAALLTMVPGAKIKMAKYAQKMLHSVSGCACGTISEIEGYVGSMKKWQDSLIDIISKRTGLKKDQVESKWFDDKDHWLTAQEALDLKLIDEIIDGKTGVKPAGNIHNAVEAMLHYENQLLNINNTEDMKLVNQFAQTLNLTGQPTEEQILAAVEKATSDLVTAQSQIKEKDTEIKNLKEKISEHDKLKMKNLIDGAISDKKFGEDLRETYTNLAENNYDAAKKAIDAMSPIKPVKDQLGDEVSADEAHKGWSFSRYQKEDAKALAEMKEKDPEAYKALYKAEFGKEPANV